MGKPDLQTVIPRKPERCTNAVFELFLEPQYREFRIPKSPARSTPVASTKPDF
jgi:hypothetical protein